MLEALERNFESNDWITIILLIVITLIILNKLKYSDRFIRVQQILSNNSYINSYSKTAPLLLSTFNIVFYLIFVIIMSFLILALLEIENVVLHTNPLLQFFFIFGLVLGFFSIRLILGVILGSLFELESKQAYFTYLKIGYMSNFSMIIFPVVVISFYFKAPFFAKLLLILSVILLLYYYALLVKNNQKFIFGNFFYFILYLCTLEIAPILIAIKLLI
ncbi:MAG: hypothetical protein CSA39_03010 [Flavobacteriales bacterium]|nr:MAG: hypothetical protein CR989_00190 [Flavobacteriales bacterium]PIE49361.1 MAG: hypothetical protein CSA39_03010 [Flavobacteriales bacterium]